MNRDEILHWLLETGPVRLEELWERADAVREATWAMSVHLRGLIEISNHCVRKCAYCGIAACAPGMERYRLAFQDISTARCGPRRSASARWSFSPGRTRASPGSSWWM